MRRGRTGRRRSGCRLAGANTDRHLVLCLGNKKQERELSFLHLGGKGGARYAFFKPATFRPENVVVQT